MMQQNCEALWKRAERLFFEQHDYKNALSLYSRILLECGEFRNKGHIHVRIGECNSLLLLFDEELKHAKQALELIDPDKDGEWYWEALWCAGLAYHHHDMAETALEYLQRALSYLKCVSSKRREDRGNFHRLLGEVYLTLDRFQESLIELNTALKAFEGFDPDGVGTTRVVLRKAQVYEELCEFDKAIALLTSLDTSRLQGTVLTQEYYSCVVHCAAQVSLYSLVRRAFSALEQIGIPEEDASLVYYCAALAHYQSDSLDRAQLLAKKCRKYAPHPYWVEEECCELLDFIQQKKRKYS